MNFQKGRCGKKLKVFFVCTEGVQKMKIRMPNKRFSGIWDQNPRSQLAEKDLFNEKHVPRSAKMIKVFNNIILNTTG